MWTPRRVVLLLGGVLLFGGVYGAYARLLGWMDGLPQIPTALLQPADGTFQPPLRTSSPTIDRLKDAFGPDCPELSDQNYPTKLEFRNGESSVVLAAGATPLVPNSNRVTLAPFSLAVFGKPRPPHAREAGEVTEISTFHADKAVMEFDRPIHSPNDMNKAKLLRLELVSEPELALPDPRRGVVHITNNQRSADPGKFLVLRTPGPVFYRDAKNNPQPGGGPDIWTDAAVEITDRQNLPRAYGAPAPPTAKDTRGADLREAGAVPAVLSGRRLPPPTVTAVGMKIFFDPEDAKPAAAAPPKKGSAGFSGVRRVELRERVLIHLWTDAAQGFVSGPDLGKPAAAEAKPAGNPLAAPEPPAAIAGVFGGTFFATQSVRQLDRALLQIETLGPFAYDVEKNVARFDVLPQADPTIPNDVLVTRITPRGGKQQLFTQVLEIEFAGPPTGGRAEAKPGAPPPAAFHRLHAWTYSPGRFLTVSSEDDRLEAYGQDLVHEQAVNRTTLTGAPLYAVRSNPPAPGGGKAGGNVLTAGAAHRPARLILEPGPDKKSTTRVEGPGKFELFDPATNENTLRASWLTSMTHAKEVVNGRELDRLTFTDGTRFEDVKADFWLKGKELKLWIEPGRRPDDRNPAAPAQALPHRVQATGDVAAHSADMDVEQAEFLNVMFRDGAAAPPPKVAGGFVGPPAPTPANPMAPAPPANPVAAAPPAEPPKEKPKPPLKIKARVVDTWVVRYPVPKPAAPPAEARAPAPAAAETALRYELEKARCEGQVVVHQDPADPTAPRGTDVIGSTLLIDHSPQGSVLTVTGTDAHPGQVHYEKMSLVGPRVVIDQLHNTAEVEGRGMLTMPAGSDFGGAELAAPQPMIVHWRDRMSFHGSEKRAEFIGKVAAVQGESWVACHTLQVTLDRPVYFNKLHKPADPKPAHKAAADPKAKADDNPKVKLVLCYPAPDDEPDEGRGANLVTFNQVEKHPTTGQVVKTQQLVARAIRVEAQKQDPGGGEPYQFIDADGPGTVRIWQSGQRDMAAAPPTTPAAAPDPADVEMKLTVVTFGGKMWMKDKGKLYQEATFTDNIQVIHAPADNPRAVIERHKLPPRAMILTCATKLVVSTHHRKDGPPAQRMDATGNAYIRSDEYDGWGETITYDGQFVVLEGGGPSPAQIRSRFKNSENSGKRIVYDRARGSYKVDDSIGVTIQGSPPAPQPAPKR